MLAQSDNCQAPALSLFNIIDLLSFFEWLQNIINMLKITFFYDLWAEGIFIDHDLASLIVGIFILLHERVSFYSFEASIFEVKYNNEHHGGVTQNCLESLQRKLIKIVIASHDLIEFLLV